MSILDFPIRVVRRFTTRDGLSCEEPPIVEKWEPRPKLHRIMKLTSSGMYGGELGPHATIEINERTYELKSHVYAVFAEYVEK